MALNIADAMGRLLRNNLGANRPMNAPAMRTPDPVPDWAKAQGITQQMWDNMGAAEKSSAYESHIQQDQLAWDKPSSQFDPVEHERLRQFYRPGQLPNSDSLRNVQNVGGDANRDVTVGINRPITQIPPSGVSVSDTITPPPPITTRDVERQLNTDSIPLQLVPTWASETFGFTQDNWNQMSPSDKNALHQRYTLLVENREVPPAVSINDSVTAPPLVDTSIPTPAAPLQPGDSGYEWDPVNDRRAVPNAQVLLPSAVNIDADSVTPGRRDLYIPPTEEFENQSASQRVMDTVPQLAAGERQEHLDTAVNPYPADTVFASQDIQHAQPDSATVTPEATVDEPAATGPIPGDRFFGKTSEEREEGLGISPGKTMLGGPVARTQMQILPGMSEDLWNKLTSPIAYGHGQTPISQAISLLDIVYAPIHPWELRELEMQGLSPYAIDLMKAQGATQEEIDKANAEFVDTAKSRKKQEQIDQYMALDDNVRAFVEGRWRPGVENFDEPQPSSHDAMFTGTPEEAEAYIAQMESQLPPEETVEEEVVQASTTPALTPAQQIEQEVQASLEAGKRPPLISPIASPPEPLPKIDFSRDEVRPERIRPLTGMERFAAAADGLLQKPGVAEGLTQLGTSLLQGEGYGVGLEELSGEITSANDVIREQEQLAEEEAKAQGKREAFGGLLQEIVEGPPEGVDPQKWQGGILSEATGIGGVEGAKVVQEFFPEEPEPLGPDWQYEKLNDGSYLLWNKNDPTDSTIVHHRPEGATDGGGQSVNEGLARLALVNFLGGQEEDPTYQNLPKTFRLAGITMNDQGVLESAGVFNKNFWKAHFADQVSGPNAMDSTLIKGVVKGAMRGVIDDETGVAMQNALNAINPVVRWLSGAQMTNAEALRYYNALIPMPGEKPKTVMAKMANQLILGAAMNPNTKEADFLALGITDTQLMHDLRGAIDRLGGENSTEAEWKELDSLLMVHMSPAGLQQQVASKIEQDVYQNYQDAEAGLGDAISGVYSNLVGRFSRGG